MQLKKLTTNLMKNGATLFTMMGLALTLISCAQMPNRDVVIKDKLIYVDKGPLGAVRFHTQNNLMKEISPEVWNSLDGNPDARFGMACMSDKTYGQSQQELNEVCSFYGACTQEDIVEAFRLLKKTRTVIATPMRKLMMSEELE